MRSCLWLYLRKTALGRWLRRHPRIARPFRWLSFRLLPVTSEARLRVRSGPAAGLWLDLNPRWEIDTWEGGFELEIQDFVSRLAREGTVFYDVGASLGFYSLIAARQRARAFAFEPDAVNAECVRRHARLNGLEDFVQVVPLAVFSHSGQLGMTVTDRDRGHAMALVNPAAGPEDGNGSDGGSFPCVTLDEFSDTHAPPSLVKIDVEGAEVEVLRGAANLLARHRPKIVCEVHSPENLEAIRGLLLQSGYRMTLLDPGERFPAHIAAEAD